MTATATDLLLEATGISKTYGAVVALASASLVVRPGEVHALLGANGAGKSTLVKILTGAVHPDAGRIVVRGRERTSHSPAEARRNGLVSVYQEPSLIPDLDIRANLRLTRTPIEPFRHWVSELGLEDIDLTRLARRLPLASLRIIDLARALAIEPDVLLMDEMTAALPANLTERVLDVIGRQRGGDRSVIFISHRMIEIAAVCDRATVLREGETVGVVDITAGSEERIVELMLGEIKGMPARLVTDAGARARADATPRVEARGLSATRRLHDASFALHRGRGAGHRRPRRPGPGRAVRHPCRVRSSDGRPAAGGWHTGLVPRPGRRDSCGARVRAGGPGGGAAHAALGPRERRAAVPDPAAQLGPDRPGRGAQDGGWRVERLQIDARAGNEVRRLSGGNQQKVTIARWVASGVKTMLCFDPTRGIDIRTKQQIYVLLRELAEAGAAVLLYTSELKEIQLVCDRAIVVFGGQVVAELDGASGRRGVAASGGAQPAAAGRTGERTGGRGRDRRMNATTGTLDALRSRPREAAAVIARRNGWTLGLLAFFVVLLILTNVIQPGYGARGIQRLAVSVLPLVMAAVAQAVVVIAGGIDLSIASMMALTSVISAELMKGQSEELAVVIVIGVILLGMLLGAINGALVVFTRVPDIVVTLATFFVWSGFALLVRPSPGGGAATWLKDLMTGSVGIDVVPKAALVILVLVGAIWIPISRSNVGLSIYAIGSSRLAAFRSGVPVGRTKVTSYVIGGLFAALGGLTLTASTGIGTPVPEPTYTLISVAAVVLGGVSLAGGVGGVVGPIIAVLVLQLIRTDMTFLRINPNMALVAQGVILIGVLMAGSWIQIRRSRT